jgi:hypothetical protein
MAMIKRFVLMSVAAVLAAAPAQAQLGDKIKINGYGSLEFEKQLQDDGKGDPNGSFDSDGFDLVLNVLPSERVRVAADLTWEHGAATEVGRGNVAVEYAFAEFLVSDWLKLRGGKMFVPFGLYNEIHTAKPLFLSVKEPFATDKTDKLGSPIRFFPRWGSGISVLGGGLVFGRDLDYVAQLSNGESVFVNPFEEDDLGSKAFAARVRYHLLSQLALGVSYYHDRFTEPTEEGEPGDGRATLASYGVTASWDGKPAGAEVAYLWGSIDPSRADTLSRAGLEAMVWANLGRVRPYLRYEWHDPNRDEGGDAASILIGGLNVRLEGSLFLKAELDRFASDPGNAKLKGADYTEFKASLAYGF